MDKMKRSVSCSSLPTIVSNQQQSVQSVSSKLSRLPRRVSNVNKIIPSTVSCPTKSVQSVTNIPIAMSFKPMVRTQQSKSVTNLNKNIGNGPMTLSSIHISPSSSSLLPRSSSSSPPPGSESSGMNVVFSKKIDSVLVGTTNNDKSVDGNGLEKSSEKRETLARFTDQNHGSYPSFPSSCRIKSKSAMILYPSSSSKTPPLFYPCTPLPSVTPLEPPSSLPQKPSPSVESESFPSLQSNIFFKMNEEEKKRKNQQKVRKTSENSFFSIFLSIFFLPYLVSR